MKLCRTFTLYVKPKTFPEVVISKRNCGISVDSGLYVDHHGLVISRLMDQLTTSYSTGLKSYDVLGENKMG